MDRSVLVRVLGKNLDDLYIDLAGDIDSVTLGVGRKSTKELIDLTIQWLSTNASILKKAICHSERLKKAVDEGDDRVKIGVVVGDILTGLSLGVSVVTLTAIIVQHGVSNICKGLWVGEDN